MDEITTIKVRTDTRRLANIVRAHTGETLIIFMDRLVRHEALRLGFQSITELPETITATFEDLDLTQL
jgi:DhnA family fructose-bisphosphate aldolase class Ia